MITRGNIADKFSGIKDHWHPRILAELNGQHVKIAKIKGEFVWHSHDEEDEMFLVINGALKIEFRDKTEHLSKGDFIVIPAGTEHKPVAEEEAEILLFEPAGTVNTGGTESGMTKKHIDFI